MKRAVGSILALSIIFCGCASQKTPERLSAQADTNIAAGKFRKGLAQYDDAIAVSDKDFKSESGSARCSIQINYDAELQPYCISA